MRHVHPIGDTHIAVIEDRPSGFGPTLWIGELRTLDDRPVTGWRLTNSSASIIYETKHYGMQACWPVTVGTTEADVLAKLRSRANQIFASAHP